MNMPKILQAIIILILTLVICSTSAAQGSQPTQETPTAIDKGVYEVTSSSMLASEISNAYLKVQAATSGRFVIGTIGGDPNTPNDDNKRLLFGYPDNIGTSVSTIRIINGNTPTDYRLGVVTGDNSGIAPVAPPTSNGTTITTAWERDSVHVEERLYFAQNADTGRLDTTSIEYIFKNNNTTERKIGLRIMLDTMIGNNDGAPFFILGTGQVTQQFEWLGANVPEYWIAYESSTFASDSLKSRGQLSGGNALKPDRFVVGDWQQAFPTVWDYTVNPSDSVANDSAVILYYDPVAIGPGQTKTIRTYYGIAKSGDVTQLKLTGIEVTQSIQNLINNVALIKGKTTFVRAHVESTSGTVKNVKAVLVGKRADGTALQGSPLSAVNEANILGYHYRLEDININQKPNRQQINDSFLFELPQSWLNGSVQLDLQITNHAYICDEQDADSNANNNGDCKIEVQFEDSPTLQVHLVSIVWRDSLAVFTHRPSETEINQVIKDIRSTFPVANLDVTRGEWVLPWDGRPEFKGDEYDDFDRIINQLMIMRRSDGCSNNPPVSCRRYYLGILADRPLFGLFGIAANIPSDIAIGYIDDELTIAHELGHAADRFHTRCSGDEVIPADPPYDYPYPSGKISRNESNVTTFFGFDTSSKYIYGPNTGDLMGYCVPSWPSDWTYEHILNHLRSRNVTNNVASFKVTNEKIVIISGLISPIESVGRIESIYNIDSIGSTFIPAPGEYAIRFENSQGQELATYNFTPNRPTEGSVELFSLALPWNTNTSRIVLLHNGQELDSHRASVNAPTVNIISPNGGESWSGSTATIRWSAGDADGDRVEYLIQYSVDAGVTWKTLASAWMSSTYEVNLETIAGSNQALVRVLATDGFHTTQDTSSRTFIVATHTPKVTIQTPENNSIYVANQMIILEGYGFDAEDGQLDSPTLNWISNLNGSLGTGASIAVNANSLSEGVHTLTLTATDSESQVGTDNISVEVRRSQSLLPTSLAVAPITLSFTVQEGGEQTTGQTLSIRNHGDGTMTWSAGTDQNWLLLSSLAGVAPTDIIIVADPTGLAAGEYSGNIIITAPNDNVQTVPVALSVASLAIAGDCNGDQSITASDITALAFEFFDGDDNNNPAATSGGSYPGNPGCDANGDTHIGASDINCMALLFFNGAGACNRVATTGASASPVLSIPSQLTVAPTGPVTVPLRLQTNASAVGSLLFSLDYDETQLSFDPADNNQDGIPDAISFNLPAQYIRSVMFDPEDADGELDVMIANFAADPVPLTDGALLSVTLTAGNPVTPTVAAVKFSQTPAASFGDIQGQDVTGVTADGSVLIDPSIGARQSLYLPIIIQNR